LQWMQLAPRLVVQAHRAPRQNFIRAISRRPVPIIAVSKSVAQSFPEQLHSHIQVYYGIPNANDFYPRRELFSHEAIRFCVMGNLDCNWKGADVAIQAFRMLPKSVQHRCELHLVYYTQPPQFPEPNIVAYSYMASSDIPAFLRRMDVMIVPSLDDRETFSQSIVQGMLTQLPCLVSDLPVLKEKIETGGGWSYVSALELASHMQCLITDSVLREKMGRIARTTALARYVWDTKYFVNEILFPPSLNEKDLIKSNDNLYSKGKARS
jgi:glycosyltransferase involved in cell wall biosynthesis